MSGAQHARRRNLRENVKDHGAIGDGTSHPLSERYATLAAAQAVYPHATALTQEIDWAAAQGAINAVQAAGGGEVFFPRGSYKLSQGGSSGGIKWGLVVKADNVILSGEGRASKLVATGDFISIFFCGQAKVQTITNWWSNLLSQQTPKTINAASAYDRTVTCTTASDAGTFGAGDAIYIRTGQMIANPNGLNREPDAEVNEVVSADSGTGVITLRWPLGKPYAQEYAANATSISSTTVDTLTLPFGVVRAEDYVIRGVGLRNIHFDSSHNQALNVILFSGCIRPKMSGVTGKAASSFISLNDCRKVQADIEVHFNDLNYATAAYASYAIGLATGCGDVHITHLDASHDKGITQLHIHEGCFRVRAQEPLLTSVPVTGSNQGVISIAGRAYDIVIVAPQIINGPVANAAIRIQANCDTGGQIISPTIKGTVASSITVESPNWVITDPKVPTGKPVKYNNSAASLKATLSPFKVEQLQAFVDYTATTIDLGTIPAGSYVRNVIVQVITAFNAGTTNTLDVGISGNLTKYVAAEATGSTGIKAPSVSGLGWSSSDQAVQARYNQSGTAPSAGRALVIVEYTRSLTA